MARLQGKVAVVTGGAAEQLGAALRMTYNMEPWRPVLAGDGRQVVGRCVPPPPDRT